MLELMITTSYVCRSPHHPGPPDLKHTWYPTFNEYDDVLELGYQIW